MKIKLSAHFILFCSLFLYSCSDRDFIGHATAVPTTEPLTTEFSLEKANTVPPDNIVILKEVYYYGAPGYLSPCEQDMYDEPKFLQPITVEPPEDNELMRASIMYTCGWKGGESLTGTVKYPDGRTEQELLQANNYDVVGEAELYFRPLYSDPEGIYEFEISNGPTTLKSTAYFSYPKEPRLYEHNHQLVFLGFSPNETLQLLMYEYRDSSDFDIEYLLEFVSWQYVRVDEKGELFLDVPIGGYCFVALTASNKEYSTDNIGSILQDSWPFW